MAALRIPKGKGNGAVAPSPGGTRAVVDEGAGADGTGARDDKVVAPSAAMLSCDMPTSTHVGDLRRAALRRSMRACRERWHQLVMMLRVPRPRWLMQEATQSRTGLSWFRPRGRTSSKGVCESTVLSGTGGVCSRG